MTCEGNNAKNFFALKKMQKVLIKINTNPKFGVEIDLWINLFITITGKFAGIGVWSMPRNSKKI